MGPKMAPVLGPKIGPPFWEPYSNYKKGPKMGAIFGPPNWAKMGDIFGTQNRPQFWLPELVLFWPIGPILAPKVEFWGD